MNKNEAAYLAPIVKAFGDGKDVQFEDQFENVFAWVTDPDPTFNPKFKWRIKPEPRVFWINPNKETTANYKPWWMTQAEYDSGHWSKECKEDFIRVIEDLSDD